MDKFFQFSNMLYDNTETKENTQLQDQTINIAINDNEQNEENDHNINIHDTIHRSSINYRQKISTIRKYNHYTWEYDGRKMISQNKIIFTHKNKKIFKILLLAPMPVEMRKDFWLIASGAKREKLNNPNYYDNLKKYFIANKIPSPYENQIELDLKRTFPEDDFFNDEIVLKKLKNILLAYSRRNNTIGYSQGFNFIVGKILKVVDYEEDAFWIFTQIVEKILPIDYFCEAAGIMVDCAILKRLLPYNNTKLFTHLQELGYEMILNSVLFKWLVSLFTQTSQEFFLCIWDSLLLEGHISLFKSTIGLLKLITNEIVSTNSIEAITKIFDKQFENIKQIDKLKYYLLVKIYDFDTDLINNNRQLIIPKVISSICRIPMTYSHIKSNNDDEECNEKWPFCVKNKNELFKIKDYFIIKTGEFPVINNYYFFHEKNCSNNYKEKYKLSKREFKKYVKNKFRSISCKNKNIDKNKYNYYFINDKENDYKNYNSLLISRQKHICNNNENLIKTDNSKNYKNKQKIILRSNSTYSLYTNFYKIIVNSKSKNDDSSININNIKTNIYKIANKINQEIIKNNDDFIKYDYTLIA